MSTTFSRKLEDTIRTGLRHRGIEADVQTEKVRFTNLWRAYVISDQIEDMSHLERQDLVWRIVRDNLTPEEQLRISMILLLTPNESGSEPASTALSA